MAIDLATEQWAGQLQEICQRDGAIQIAAAPASDDEAVVFSRVRLLECALHLAEPYLLVERPTGLLDPRGFSRGKPIQGLILRPPEVFVGFDCRVIEPARFRLNVTVTLAALKLTAPQNVRPMQRRQYFRVETAGVRLPPALFTPCPDDAANGTTRGNAIKSWSAPIVNLSGGGLAVTHPRGKCLSLTRGQQFRCRLNLPTATSPLEVLVNLAHIRAAEKEGMTYLGFQIIDPDPKVRKLCTDAICLFVSAVQRQQLQRRRD